jgi:hypothetical protein
MLLRRRTAVSEDPLGTACKVLLLRWMALAGVVMIHDLANWQPQIRESVGLVARPNFLSGAAHLVGLEAIALDLSLDIALLVTTSPWVVIAYWAFGRSRLASKADG